MRWVVLVASLLLASVVDAQPSSGAGPIRVAFECQTLGRTKMCPAFLISFVEANPVLLYTPRANADVVVYVNSTEIALTDRVHLRFLGQMPHAPPVVEATADVDTRAADDAQRAQLEQAFLRGIALYVGTRFPQAVTVTLGKIDDKARMKKEGSPWGFSINVNGNGSYTERFRTAEGGAVIAIKYLERRLRFGQFTFIDGGLERQPPLTLDDGRQVSLDIDMWSIRSGGEIVYSFDDTWSLGAGSYTALSDRKAQSRWDSRSRVAFAWNAYPADDPRGNKLEIYGHLGWAIEKYNLPNEIGERFAHYPLTGINASGSVRKDQTSYGVNLETNVQILAPGRRYSVEVAPFVTFQIGQHVDLSLSVSLTKRELPAPDMNAIDPLDYEQLSRLSYAEPLSFGGSIGLTIRFDPSNGVRNNRIESI